MSCEDEFDKFQDAADDYEKAAEKARELAEKSWELAKDMAEHCGDVKTGVRCMMDIAEWAANLANLEHAIEQRDQAREEMNEAGGDLLGCMCKEYGYGAEGDDDPLPMIDLTSECDDIEYPGLEPPPYPWEPDVSMPDDVLE